MIYNQWDSNNQKLLLNKKRNKKLFLFFYKLYIKIFIYGRNRNVYNMNNIETIKIENGTSGRMYVEKYVKKNYPEIFNDVIEFCNDKLVDLPFKEKVYHYVNDLKNNVYCSNPNCKNLVNFKNSTLGYNNYCSNACVSSDPNIKKIKEDKSYLKFGTKAPGMNSDIKEKMIKTNQERYGSNSPLQNDEVQKKSKDTLFKNYGVDNPNKSEELKIKRIASFKKSNYKENYLKTMMDRYGVEYPYQIPEILQKSKDTLFKNYGVLNPYKNVDIVNDVQEKRKNTWIYNKISNDENIINIDSDNREYTIKCDAGKEHTFKISFELYKSRKQFATYMCNECFPEHFNQTSMSEHDFLSFVKSVYFNDILENSKRIISPYELDVFLPELKIGFEFNGIYWHNELYKDSNYHLKKTELCESNDIKLIHIYEDDWMYKNDIVKSRILNVLNLTPNKIYARKTEIKEITDNKIVREFLEKNHIQGFIGSQFKFGLYYNDELVSIMNFGKQRKNMGIKSSPECYELLRFCNKLNTNVIGGASKLFKYFIKNYNPNEITTYADRSISQGELYRTLGFTFIGKTQPNYYYVISRNRYHRFNFRKDILVKKGFDPNKTEHEIMLERKIYRIFDSGNLKYKYKNIKI